MTGAYREGVSDGGYAYDYVTYAHDALGRRIGRNAAGEVAHAFHSARWQVLEETTATGSVAARYVWGGEVGGYVDRLVLRDTPASGGTVDRLYVQQDANYSVTALTNDQGQVVERYVYDPYGRRTVLAANWQPLSDNQSPWGFAPGHQGGRH